MSKAKIDEPFKDKINRDGQDEQDERLFNLKKDLVFILYILFIPVKVILLVLPGCGVSGLGLFVDLRLLQPAAEIPVNNLHPAEEIDCPSSPAGLRVAGA